MPLVNRTIPNLVQGVSQQPEVLRLPSQATTQENGYSSVVEGLKRDHLQVILQKYLLVLYLMRIFMRLIEIVQKDI